MTYGELWARTNDLVLELRRLGISRYDRVAVLLPRGAESAVAMVAVAAGAVCVPLNPDFTGDELRRYFSDLQIAALLTQPDTNPASRGVANTLGIPVIDLVPQPRGNPAAFLLTGSTARTHVTSVALAPDGNDDAFILVTSGTTSRPKMVPLTHANVCLSAYNVGAVLAVGPQDRLLNVLSLFHAHGLISGLLAALAAGSSVICTPWLRRWAVLWMARRAATDVVHRGPYDSSGNTLDERPSQTQRPAIVLANYSFGFRIPSTADSGMGWRRCSVCSC